MNNKTKKTLVTSIAAVFAAATLALFGISGKTVVEMEYKITETDSEAYMEVYAPDEYKLDVVELLCNGQSVTKMVLPRGRLITLPFIFSNLNNCELRFSKLDEVVGIGTFKDGKLYVALRDDIGNGAKSEEKSDNEQKTNTDNVEISDDNPLNDVINTKEGAKNDTQTQ